MKPFLSIDITTDKKNELENGREFIAAKISEQQAQAIENAANSANELLNETKLPLPLTILRYVCVQRFSYAFLDLLRRFAMMN